MYTVGSSTSGGSDADRGDRGTQEGFDGSGDGYQGAGEKPARRRFVPLPSEWQRFRIWLQEQGVDEAVMESTAQYWRSVWLELERRMGLHLAQAFSHPARRGRKHDFQDAERLVRLIACPGKEESAEQNQSSRCAKGNKYLGRVLNQAAHAAVTKKGCHFQVLFRRLMPRLGDKSALWAVAHRLCRVVCKILQEGVRFIEQGHEGGPGENKQRAPMLARCPS